MVIPPEETFDYSFLVTEDTQRGASSPAEPGTGDRLVGPSPALRIIDAGLWVVPSSVTGLTQQRVMRSRIQLTAHERSQAVASEASFHVDQTLTAALRPGDSIRVVRSHLGGLALSIMRGHELVAAAGAVTALPLGPVVARIPRELIEGALDVFRPTDPDFEFREWPVEVAVGDQRSIMFTGRREFGGYDVFVEHGLWAGTAGVPECVAISRDGLVDELAAITSAQLMQSPDALTITAWT
jgi:hypothetical protein